MNLKIVEFCAREVEYQHRGPTQVWWMLEAWKYFREWEWDRQFLLLTIQRLGHYVERDKNPPVPKAVPPQWRSVGVRVGTSIKPPPCDMLRLMQSWSENVDKMGPEEAYHQFEEIHPFVDGNGRVGKIIYNWKAKTLENPTFPSTYKEDLWHKERGFKPSS